MYNQDASVIVSRDCFADKWGRVYLVYLQQYLIFWDGIDTFGSWFKNWIKTISIPLFR